MVPPIHSASSLNGFHLKTVFDPSGRFLRAFGSQGEAPGKFSYPLGVTTDALNFIYVCEEARIQVYSAQNFKKARH